MPKFILIDHSIADVGGHYYEYAGRVLSAAREAGFEPVLATNVRFQGAGREPWQVLPVYRHDFFGPKVPGRLAWCGERMAAVVDRFDRLRYRLMFSKLAATIACLASPSEINRRDGRRYLVLGLALQTVLFLLRCLALVRRVVRFLVAPAFQCCAAAVRTRVLKAARQAKFWLKRRHFASDSARLFRDVPLQPGDVVFIPTLCEADMLGLLRLFHINRQTANAAWHLVFRRDVCPGNQTDDAVHDERLHDAKAAFRRFQSCLRGQSVWFYTDTDELTSQYNRLGAAVFRTLPIPIAPSLAPAVNDGRRSRASRLFHVVYIGDARTEKGYHWLPCLVADAFAKRLPARFTFQSNYNVPGGETAAAVARAQLETLPPDRRVTLLTRPLSSSDYRELLLAADVILIPYDRESYDARSSGIFAEAMVAGKPVIVPAGTWMARQLADELSAYHDGVVRRHRVVGTAFGSDFRWQTGPGETTVRSGHHASARDRASARNAVFAGVNVANDATYLRISGNLRDPLARAFSDIEVQQLRSDGERIDRRRLSFGGNRQTRASALVALADGVEQVQLVLENRNASEATECTRLRFDFLSVGNLPLGTIGAVYAEPEELCSQLSEIVSHYDHYRETAVEFSRAWSAYHCPQVLIEELLNQRPLLIGDTGRPKRVANQSSTTLRSATQFSEDHCHAIG